MTDSSSRETMDTLLFTNLITMLGSSTMQQLGKLVNPMTNETEINLEGAQVTIDMLSMLKTKTAGNLHDQEERMLSDLISSLQMNYVEVSKEKPEDTAKADDPEEAQEDKDQPEEAEDDASSPEIDEKAS